MNVTGIGLNLAQAAIYSALVICGGPALSQEPAAAFPSRNISLVVPFGAGGPPDSIARVIADGLGKSLGKPVIVVNKPGASTTIANASVARAAPDGYTLLAVDISFAVTPHIADTQGVDHLKDFRAIGQSAKSVFVLMAAPSLGTPTLGSFLKLAKEKPEAIEIAHTGIGTTPHLAAITFTKSAGINPLLVPYKTVADATNNVLAGHISAVFSAASNAIALAKDGKVHVLGVTGNTRMKALPEVPTFAENGIPMNGFEGGSWYGIVVPAETPDDIVAKLNTALRETVGDKALQDKFSALGLELTSGPPKDFQDLIAAQYRFWGQTLQANGIKPER